MARRTSGLRLGEGLVLPLKFATEGVVAVGMRGSGKSNTLVRWAEVLYAAGIPWVAIDPKGDWGGIRSSADGTKPGLSIAVFGGLDESFPLTEYIGAAIADLLVDHNMSAVLDVSRLPIAARARFLTDFCNRLMDRHQAEPHVRCVILEEAHRYIPQRVTKETAKVKEAAAAILLEGRAFGLGCWGATQRPARLHKDVLEEVGTAVLHRIGAAATNDLRTISGWVKHEELGDEIVPSLTKLASGEAWILAPSTLGIAQRVMIDRRTTYDSAATPLVGAGSRPTLTLADVDAAAIKEALADTIERAKADDPKVLHRRITELQRQLAVAEARQPATVEVEVPILPVATLEGLRDALSVALDELRTALTPVTDVVMLVDSLLAAPAPRTPSLLRQLAQPVPPTDPTRGQAPGPPPATGPTQDVVLKAGARRLLETIARHHPMRHSKAQVGTLAGFKITGGTFQTYFSTLRRHGLVDIDHEGLITATTEGLAAAGVDEPRPMSPDEVLELWRTRLKRGARQMLDALVETYPAGYTRGQLADLLAMAETGGTFQTYLSTLRRNGLADVVDGGLVVASDTLFLEAAGRG